LQQSEFFNKLLESLVAQGRFREDFFFRLNVLPLRLPALRGLKSAIRPRPMAKRLAKFVEVC